MEEVALLWQKDKEMQGKLGNLEGHLLEYLLKLGAKKRRPGSRDITTKPGPFC